VAIANLANAIGVGGEEVEIDSRNLATAFEAADVQKLKPTFEQVPIFQAANAALDTGIQQKRVLQKEYYPIFHFLGGFSLRGSGLGLNGTSSQSLGGNGVFPVVPNYQAALIINWNFLDWFRLHQEKRIQDERIIQQHQDANLVLQNLRTQDNQSRARVNAALELAANMPILTESARVAASQAEARYSTGLGSVAQVAEANQVLANARVQESVAKIAVWRAMLGVAAVHGDLKPFISEADRIQGAQ
jgi:outer membrane protein TolC